MIDEDIKRRRESVNADRHKNMRVAHIGGTRRDDWQSLLAMDEDSSFPIDHCAVLSEN